MGDGVGNWIESYFFWFGVCRLIKGRSLCYCDFCLFYNEYILWRWSSNKLSCCRRFDVIGDVWVLICVYGDYGVYLDKIVLWDEYVLYRILFKGVIIMVVLSFLVYGEEGGVVC